MHDITAVSPRVAIVILTWDGRDLTLDCLRSLEAVRTASTSITVVDNASADDTVAAVRARYGARVAVVENASNLGFAGGNNVGIERALSDGAQFILLLNNDTTVDPAFLDEMLRAMLASDHIGITGPKIYYSSPPDRIWFAGGEISMWRGTARHIGIRDTDRGQHDTARDVDYVSGCALLARREVFERVGLLDTSYRAYFEDADFCLRASRAGFRVRYIPTAKVWHRISSSTGGQLSRRKIARKTASARRFFGVYARPHHWITIPLFFGLDVIRIGLLVLAGRIRDTGPRTPQSML
jgi:GT2 family glycosyltransferase